MFQSLSHDSYNRMISSIALYNEKEIPKSIMLGLYSVAINFSQRTMRHLVLESEENAKNESSSLSSSLSFTRIENSTFNEISVNPILLQRKIVNLADSINDKLRKGEHFFSLELFPSKKSDKEAYERFFLDVSLSRLAPLFYAMTWHENPSVAEVTHLPLKIVKNFPNNTLLHVAANNLKKAQVHKILNGALAQGKTNIFALRGDGCTGSGDFEHAVDLVKFIRLHYSNKFSICVAGYPQMHPESISKKMEMMHLKEKVNAGANFIITQIFFEAKVFVDFVKDCRKSDIIIPIIPGIFPIPNYKSLLRMAKLCNVEIPLKVLKDLEPIKDNDDKVYAYGILTARKLILKILASEAASGFHLFTLNRASIGSDVCGKIFN